MTTSDPRPTGATGGGGTGDRTTQPATPPDAPDAPAIASDWPVRSGGSTALTPSDATAPRASAPAPRAAARPDPTARPAGSGPRASSPDPEFPKPQGPPTTGAAGHVVGVLIGLAVTAVALFVLALGMSRIVADGVGGETVSADGFGILLVTLGAILTALVALLAVRTSAIPFTGGLVALVVGAAYLFAPVASHRESVRILATAQNRDAVLNAASVATTGVFFVVGLVLIASGTAASLVRRRGIEVGSFRERTHGAGR